MSASPPSSDDSPPTSLKTQVSRSIAKKLMRARAGSDRDQAQGLLQEDEDHTSAPTTNDDAAQQQFLPGMIDTHGVRPGRTSTAAGASSRGIDLSELNIDTNSPIMSSPNSNAPFAALSGGSSSGGSDEERKVGKKNKKHKEKHKSTASSTSSSQHSFLHNEFIDKHHALPASSPPPFLTHPSTSPTAPSSSSPLNSNGGGSRNRAIRVVPPAFDATTRLASRDEDGVPIEDADDDPAFANMFAPRVIWRQRLREFCSPSVWFYHIKHAVRELKKRKCNYALGLFSCFLVVCVAAVCFTLIARAPVVFLQQAEANVGQTDLILTPAAGLGSFFVNYSTFATNVGVDSNYAYHAARTVFDSFVLPDNMCKFPPQPPLAPGEDPVWPTNPSELDFQAVQASDWKYTGFYNDSSPACSNTTISCIEALCIYPDVTKRDVPFWTIDTEREKAMGLGRLWPFDALGVGQALITSDLADGWNLKAGDKINVRFGSPKRTSPQMSHILQTSMIRAFEWQQASGANVMDSNATFIMDAFVSRFTTTVYLPFTVVGVIEKTYGKFTTDTDPLVLVEQEHFLPYLWDYLHPNLKKIKTIPQMASLLPQAAPIARAANYTTTNSLPNSVTEFVTVLYPSEGGLNSMMSYATHIVASLGPRRVEVYLNTNFDTIQGLVIEWSSHLIYFAGFTQLDVQLPILDEMNKVKMFSLYLGLILSIILTILFLLSILLIYSLLLISIETRTFELGVSRMSGMNRFNLMKLLIIQALSFSIPAWVVGMVCSQIVVAIIVAKLEASVEVPLDRLLTKQSVRVATLMGLFLPLIASILPIRKALSSNLNDALDTRHSKTVGVAFHIERSVEAGMDKAWLAVGTGLAVVGGSIYYVVPLALVSFNLALFINIFFALLLGMLLGLILLSLNFQPVLERLLVFLTLWWEARSIQFLVLKNLVAHRDRNRKTSIMFALSLGFILFITIAFQLELWTAKARMYKNYGSDMIVYPHYTGQVLTKADVTSLETLLETNNHIISQWSWVTSRLKWNNEFDDTYISNVGHAFQSDIEIWGISSNFFETTFNEYLVVDEDTPSESSAQFSEQIYTVSGSQAAILGTNNKKQFGISSTNGELSSFLYALQRRASDTRPAALEFHRMRALTFLDNAPRFAVNKFTNPRAQPTVVSLPTFMRLSGNKYKSIQDLPMASCILNFQPHITNRDKDAMFLALTAWVNNRDFLLWDIRKTSSQLDRSNAVMGIIFSAATYIAMFLCLFSLVASMLTNIYEQSKEISVLRAVGMTKPQIARLYTHESFVLVMSSSLLGIAIGFIMSGTLIAQRILFTQLPVPLIFPWAILGYTFTGAIICAIISSLMPARELMKRSIASLMKTVL